MLSICTHTKRPVPTHGNVIALATAPYTVMHGVPDSVTLLLPGVSDVLVTHTATGARLYPGASERPHSCTAVTAAGASRSTW